MENLLLLILGVFISVIGIINIKGNVSSVHSYNRRKVKDEDIPKYGKVIGTGTLILGVSLVVAYLTTFWTEALAPYTTLVGIVVGLAFILYGQIKYNRGIF